MTSTIGEATLKQMELDAEGMKAELHVANHVRALVAELRRLAGSGAPPRPGSEEVHAALMILNGAHSVPSGLQNKAVMVLDAFFAPFVPAAG